MPEDSIVRRVYRMVGEVQRVGYREKVKGIAIRLGVSGRVMNLADDTVEVVCEGPRGLLDRFLEAIMIRKGLINVERAVLLEEAPAEPGGPLFESVRGAWQDEMIERGDAAAAYLGVLSDKTDITHSKLDGLGQQVQAFRAETNRNFRELGERYQGLGDAARLIVEEVRGLRQDLRERQS